tara:strand:+ start:1481 stop:2167 length:687 start_codon:yes stop_codon:yes gene_type:complete
MKQLILFGIVASLGFSVFGQEINKFDENGKRHGLWRKTYENSKQVRYEGTFNHGKETGVFKFYCGECGDQPTALRTFNEKDGSVWVQYFTIKGKLVSEGKMINQAREGEWLYYHEKSDRVMNREQYLNGKKDGKQTTYYPNGQMTEEIQYKNGLKEGFNYYYSPEGVLLKELEYHNNELHGPAKHYDAQGNLVIEGYYKEGKKHGVWKYFKNGVLELEETYPKPQKRG